MKFSSEVHSPAESLAFSVSFLMVYKIDRIFLFLFSYGCILLFIREFASFCLIFIVAVSVGTLSSPTLHPPGIVLNEEILFLRFP